MQSHDPSFSKHRSIICRAMLMASILVLGAAAATHAHPVYPSKPIRIIVGSGPGGASDLPARPLAQQLEAILKQPVIIENRPGSGTVLAARAVRSATPDGHTLFFGNPTIFSEHLMRNGIDATKEMSPIVDVIRGDIFVIASASSGIDSVEKMVQYARASALRCGYVSQATSMTIAMIAASQKFKYDCIPYRSLDQVIQGLVSNDIQVTVGALTGFSSLLETNKVLLVGAATQKRSSFSPKTRTLSEQGAPVVVPFRNGLWGPPNLPEEISRAIANAVGTVSTNKAFAERMQVLGNEVDILSAREQRQALIEANLFFAAGARLTGYEPE